MGKSKFKWYVVIVLGTLIYATFRCAYYRPSPNVSVPSIFWNLSIIVALYGGIVAFFFHKPWFGGLLKSGAWLALFQAMHTLYVIFSTLEGEPTLFVVLGILTAMIPLNAWPIILLIWAHNLKTTNVEEIMGGTPLDPIDNENSNSEREKAEKRFTSEQENQTE
jgi:hypothetical protein